MVFIRTITLVRPTKDVGWILSTNSVKNLIQKYKESGKLLQRTISYPNELTINDEWIWNSKQDFVEFFTESIYTDFMMFAGEYTYSNNIDVTARVIED